MTLTNPYSPIIVAGETYPTWRPETECSTCVRVTMGPDAAAVFMANLGQHFPGKTEDGTDVLWLISTVHIVPEGAEVILLPQTAVPNPGKRIQVSLPMAAGTVATQEMAKSLEGQWLTILLAGRHVLTQVIQADTVPDGRHVDLLLESDDWPGLVIHIPEVS